MSGFSYEPFDPSISLRTGFAPFESLKVSDRVYDRTGESWKTLKGGSDILSDFGYSEVLADLPGKEVPNLIVSWNRRSFVQFRIPPP